MQMFSPIWRIVPPCECSLRSLSLLHSVVHRAKRLCEGELCYLENGRKVSGLCLVYEI